MEANLASSRVRVPIVVITGHHSAEPRDQAMSARPVAYLSKPFNDESLLDAIASAPWDQP
jgi:FixJ family two-component response regulator